MRASLFSLITIKRVRGRICAGWNICISAVGTCYSRARRGRRLTGIFPKGRWEPRRREQASELYGLLRVKMMMRCVVVRRAASASVIAAEWDLLEGQQVPRLGKISLRWCRCRSRRPVGVAGPYGPYGAVSRVCKHSGSNISRIGCMLGARGHT